MKEPSRSTPLFALALFALLLACVLVLVLLCTGQYGGLVEGQNRNRALRASLSYLSQRLAAADEAGAVILGQGPEGDALVLTEPLEQTGYETRIYLWQGSLMEEYAPAGTALDPGRAAPVAATSQLALRWAQPGLLEVTTGEGTVLVALHAAGGEQP